MGAMSNRRGGISLYARRFHWLLVQLEQEGFSQTAIAKRLGMTQSYISKWRNPDTGGRQDVGGLTIERVLKGLKISGEYFTGDYPPDERKDYKVFSLDKARETRDQKDLVEAVRKLNDVVARMSQRLAALEERLATPRSGRSQ